MQAALHTPFDQTVDFVANVKNEHFWREQFPMLSMEDASARPPVPATLPSVDVDDINATVLKEGYISGTSDYLKKTTPALEAAILKCKSLGISPTFLFLFDEPWECFRQLHPLLTHILGEDYLLLPDFWAWHVDFTKGENGWGIHRDKGTYALDAEGRPLSMTVWIPITESTPENGCIYLVPAHLDNGYRAPRGSQPDFDYASIRALPRKPGDFLAWNQNVLHWGARSSPRAKNTRMSMALEFQRGDIPAFNQPLLKPLAVTNFRARLLLIAKQILQYQHMYALSPEMREMAEKLMRGE